jgi:phospholipid/cholesterol/gamma-HCH transport system substrate-binding protein
MEGRANYAFIGAAIVAGALLTAAFVIWLGGFNPSRKYEEFEVVFVGPVRGLQQASEVRFNGIKVGEVTNLRIDPDAPTKNVIARVRVDGHLPINASTIAQLELNALTNVALIQLSGGDPNAPSLRGSGGNLPRLQGKGGSLDKLVLSGEDLLRNSNEVILQLKDVLTPENVKQLSQTLANLNRASRLMAQQNGLIENANGAAQSMDRFAASGADAAEEAKTAIAEAREAAASFRAANDNASIAMQETAGAVPQFAASARELQSLAQRLEEIADELDRSRAGYLAAKTRPVRELPR